MAKGITLGGILAIVIVIIILGQLPSGDVTDSKSAIKNAKQGIATDTVVKAGGEIIDTVGDQAIDSACSNGSSQACSTTTTSVNMVGVAFAVFVIGVIIAGVIGLIKFAVNVIESF